MKKEIIEKRLDKISYLLFELISLVKSKLRKYHNDKKLVFKILGEEKDAMALSSLEGKLEYLAHHLYTGILDNTEDTNTINVIIPLLFNGKQTTICQFDVRDGGFKTDLINAGDTYDDWKNSKLKEEEKETKAKRKAKKKRNQENRKKRQANVNNINNQQDED